MSSADRQGKGLDYLEVKGGKDALLVGLHGRGSSPEGFASVAELISPDFTYIFPRAPFRFLNGYEWYHFDDRQEEGIMRSMELLGRFFSEIKEKYQAGKGKIILFGFSQGAVMAFHYGLQHPRIFSGLIGMSGYLYRPERLSRLISKEAEGMPVLIIHGSRDEVITDEFMTGREIETYLRGFRIGAEFLEFDMGHEVTMESLDAARNWIEARIKK
ncbi:MAG: hypothetical protein HYX24_04345 [Candidatus Aenigmarchaeota archaeon]|nr:hypothetical protein [Candidatus Aenigmarchaeota archaeon]